MSDLTLKIVQYDLTTGMVFHVVDPPYSEAVYDLHSGDTAYGFLQSDDANAHAKCAMEVEGVMTLVDRPAMGLTGSLDGTTYTVSALQSGSLIWVDDNGPYENGDDTTAAIQLDTTGTYSITVVRAPYLETTLTAER